MANFININELKGSVLNANLDDEYIQPAINEAQNIYLREIIGDALYNTIENKINDNNLTGKYATLVNNYIKPFLTYKVQSLMVIPVTYKLRNAGVVQQFDQGFNTTTVKDTAYMADYYNNKAEFYANRLTEYLSKNTADIPEYAYSDQNITNPTPNITAGTIYLGGGRKRPCGLKTGSGGGSTDSVEWNDIQNKPDFAEVATSGSYNDLEDTPEIPTVNDATINIYQGNTLKGSFSLNQENGQNIDLEAGGSGSTDWNDIQNKPDFATVATSGSYNDLQDKPSIPAAQVNADWNSNSGVSEILNKPSLATVATTGNYSDLNGTPTIPTKTSELTNDSGFTTFSGDYNDLSNRPDMDEYVDVATYNQKMNDVDSALENRVTYGVYTPKIAAIDSALTDKVDTMALCTINNERLDTRSNFELVRTDSIARVATTGSYTDLNDKPTIPTKTSELTNDSGFTTFSGDYNDLQNKPTIPAAQVQADWQQNDSTQPDYIKNRPSMPSAQVQSDWNQTNTSEVDYIKNKPTIPVVPTNVSAFDNDAGYLTQHQSLAGYATENWVQQQGYSTFSGSYNDLSDKPTIPTKTSELTNDSGYSTFDGDYNSLTNKPTIPAAQVQSDWNQSDTTAVDYIKNKPNVKPDLDLSTLTQAQYVDFYSNYTTYRTNYDLNWGGLPILSINSWQPPVEMSPVPVMVVQYGIYGQSALMTGGDDEVFFGVQLVAADGSVMPYSDSMTFKQICHTASYNDLVNKPALATVATSGSYNDLSDKPTIPTKTSELTNDSGYSTFSGSYNDLSDKPTIPTKTSELTNDSGYSTFSGSYNDLSDKPTIPAAQVQSDWNAVSGVSQILNKPTIPTVNDSTINIYQGSTLKGSFSLNQSSGQNINLDAGGSGSQVQSDWNQSDNIAVDFIKNKPTVYNHWFGTQAQYDLLPTKDINTIYHIEGAAPMQSDWNEADPTSMAYINNKPNLATVATSGNYSDLNGTPSIPAAQVQSDWNAVSGMGEILNKPSLATVATSGNYNDLTNKPTIPVVPSYTTETWTFTLSDQSTVTKTVYLVPSV